MIMKTTLFLQFVALALLPTTITAQGAGCQIHPLLSASQCLRAASIGNNAQVILGDCVSNSHWVTQPISFNHGTTRVALVRDNGEVTDFCLDIGDRRLLISLSLSLSFPFAHILLKAPSVNFNLRLFNCMDNSDGRAVDQQRVIWTRDGHLGMDSTGICLQYDTANNIVTSEDCADNTANQLWAVVGNC